ncbi:hypothetical protein [Sedimentibacter sp.]|uniref:hypothetical protein n=1 Tax=Sedimentibacter sp. TaxID=1960295 RepID=UPI0028978BEE|nr:hypothetical protein [Sedimentibacter sp.]
MTFDSAVRFCKERKLKIILSIVVIIIICLYLKVFFTTGIYYGDAFLKKEIVNEEAYYRGKSEYAEISIKKDLQHINKTEFTFNFFDGVSDKYVVYFNENEENNVLIEDGDGNSLFAGRYKRGHFTLYDEHDEPFYENYSNVIIYGEENTDTDSHKVPYKRMVETSVLEKDRIRGDIKMMLAAVVLLTGTFIDIKWPLLFFRLSYFLSVENPQPTELYLAMQKISWVVIPGFAIIFLIVAI